MGQPQAAPLAVADWRITIEATSCSRGCLAMSTAVARKVEQRESIRLSCVDWRTYSRLLDIFEDHRGFRLAYDHGELEIMSPTLQHDDDNRTLADLVFVLTEELRMPLKHGG